MDVNEVLAWADKLVFAKTGAHLNSLQQAILAGAWDSQKYRDIAEDYHCSEPNVKRVAASLWKLISDELDEKIDKKNFRATMERFYISKSKIQNFVQSNFNQGEIKFCGESWHSDNTGKLRSPSANSSTNSPSKQPEQRHNLTEAPEWEHHNNRRAEITTLKQWILDEKIRLVSIFGLPGMGKTTLARELVEQIKDNFDYILWRNCSETLSLKSFQTNLIEFFSQNQETKSSSLIDYLRLNLCLIILDDFQELFAPEKFAGTYLPEAESYGKFLKEMARKA